MSVRLLVRQRSEQGGAEKAVEIILEDEVINLGREKTCQVVLAQQAVSRSHARISRDGSLFFLEDLGSSYGTQINGKSLPKGEKRLLRNGDVIAIAQFDLTFDRVTDPPKGQPATTNRMARQVVKDVMRGLSSGQENPYFRLMNGPKEGQRIELLDAQELLIGREETADIVLDDDLVSRRHAKIRRDWSGTHVEDLGSRNGIKVNKKWLKKKTLKDRDELEIGSFRLLYLDPSEVREAPVVLPEEEGEATTPEPPLSGEGGAASEEEELPSSAPEEQDPPETPGADPAEEDGGAEPAAEGAEGEAEDEPAPEAPGEEQPPAEEPQAEQAPPMGLVGKLPGVKDKSFIPLAAMALLALFALALIIALLVGA